MEHMYGWILAAAAVIGFFGWLMKPTPQSPNIRRAKRPLDRDAHERVDWSKATEGLTKTGKQYLVVGVGFLGRRIVKYLLERGEERVRCFDIAPTNPFAGDARVEYVVGSVESLEELTKATEGVEVVFSTFAIIKYFERMDFQAGISERINIGGTQNLLAAMKTNSVSILVQTSSSNVALGKNPRLGMDESEPRVTRETMINHYGWTKAQAEKDALDADGSTLADGRTMATCAVRPCSGIFGHDDRMIIQRFLDTKLIQLFFWAKIDYIYVDNVVWGHFLAEEKLANGAAGVRGEMFNVTNRDPMSSEDLHSIAKDYLEDAEVKYLPLHLMTCLAYVSEWITWLSNGKADLGDLKLLTPATFDTAAYNYTFIDDKAKKYLGYDPIFTVEEGVQRSIKLHRELQAAKEKSA